MIFLWLPLAIVIGLGVGVELGNLLGWAIVRRGREFGVDIPFSWHIFTMGPNYIDYCSELHNLKEGIY